MRARKEVRQEHSIGVSADLLEMPFTLRPGLRYE